jgi:FtsZ-interacting cell division protein YlmF
VGKFKDFAKKILPGTEAEYDETREDYEDEEKEEENEDEYGDEYGGEYDDDEDDDNDYRYEPEEEEDSKFSYLEDYNSSKVVDFNMGSKSGGNVSHGVKFVRPVHLSDAAEPANMLRNKEIVIVCFDENISSAEAGRILDFLQGVVYILKADIKRIEKNSYIMIPEGVPSGGVDLNTPDNVRVFTENEY